jgi:hypothetical protein
MNRDTVREIIFAILIGAVMGIGVAILMVKIWART